MSNISHETLSLSFFTNSLLLLISSAILFSEIVVRDLFLSICSSGCLSVEKFDDSLECSGGKQLFKTIHSAVIAVLPHKIEEKRSLDKVA